MNSIVQDLSEERCFLCGKTRDLDLHHIMHGVANRRWATRLGLTCWLCRGCHTLAHCDFQTNKRLQAQAQAAFEQTHTRQEWMNIFGKNYLLKG